MIVPDFFKPDAESSTTSRRRLFEAGNIDFNRDLFKVKYILNSKAPIKDLKYTTEV